MKPRELCPACGGKANVKSRLHEKEDHALNDMLDSVIEYVAYVRNFDPKKTDGKAFLRLRETMESFVDTYYSVTDESTITSLLSLEKELEH